MAGLTLLLAGSSNIGCSGSPTDPGQSTYNLSGLVIEAEDFPLKDARIELIGGPMSGRVAMTDSFGRFAFTGVTGVLQVQASKDGYVAATKSVSSSNAPLTFVLIPNVPSAAISGVYRLTFTAAASCDLPDDARRRTYTATIDQVGAKATVRLSDAQFFNDSYCGLMNSFEAFVYGNTVSLGNWGGECGIIEQLANMRYLKLWGGAEAIIVTESIPGAFSASVSVVSSPDAKTPIATCTASDHQLMFERLDPTGPAAVGMHGVRLGRERTK
jgi:hypothetical protein